MQYFLSSLLGISGILIASIAGLVATLMGERTMDQKTKRPSLWGYTLITFTLIGVILSIVQYVKDSQDKEHSDATMEILNRVPRQVAILKYEFEIPDSFGDQVWNLKPTHIYHQLLKCDGNRTEQTPGPLQIHGTDVVDFDIFIVGKDVDNNNADDCDEITTSNYDMQLYVTVDGRTHTFDSSGQRLQAFGENADLELELDKLALKKTLPKLKGRVVEVCGVVTSTDQRWFDPSLATVDPSPRLFACAPVSAGR